MRNSGLGTDAGAGGAAGCIALGRECGDPPMRRCGVDTPAGANGRAERGALVLADPEHRIANHELIINTDELERVAISARAGLEAAHMADLIGHVRHQTIGAVLHVLGASRFASSGARIISSRRRSGFGLQIHTSQAKSGHTQEHPTEWSTHKLPPFVSPGEPMLRFRIGNSNCGKINQVYAN
jgi:hypothetical protein